MSFHISAMMRLLSDQQTETGEERQRAIKMCFYGNTPEAYLIQPGVSGTSTIIDELYLLT